jgi:hypothetical protein
LIKWHGLPEDDATWESLEEFRAEHPDFQLEDELFLQAERDVMIGIPTGVAGPLVARRGASHQGAMAHIIVTIIVFLEGYFIIIAIRET